MTGYQSKKKAASAKTIDEVNWADHEPDGRSHLYKRYDDLYVVYLNGVYDGKKAAQAEAERGRERNFCERCGKRLGAADHIHTCTPPQEKNT
jgi:hypothetical protein